MLRTATDTRAAKKAPVRTYDQPSYRDPWRVVQDYRRVRRVMTDNTDEVLSALSSEVDSPEGGFGPGSTGTASPTASADSRRHRSTAGYSTPGTTVLVP